MGSSGATAMLILLFLAVTSACSAELIAVSNLLTYDVYGTYINKNPSEKQILWSSHVCILAYALFMGAIATAFNYIGVSMGYLYELMGSIIGSAVVPVALCITWKKCNGTGAIVGAIVGFAAAMAGWIGITAHLNDGVVDVNTTFGDYEMLTGNLLAIGVGGIITVGWSLVRPANFDFEITRAINVKAVTPITTDEALTPGLNENDKEAKNLGNMGEPMSVPGTPPLQDYEATQIQSEEERAVLQKAFRFATMSALALTLILIFVSYLDSPTEAICEADIQIIPLPLFFSSYIYPEKGFTAWVIVSLLWLFVGLAVVGIYPLWESRKGIMSVVRGISADVSRLRK